MRQVEHHTWPRPPRALTRAEDGRRRTPRVRRESYEALLPAFAGGRFSLYLWEALGQSSGHKPNRHGTAVLWSDTFKERRAYLLAHLVAPWKLMLLDLAFRRNVGYFTARFVHALNGRCGRNDFDKPPVSLQVADWLEHQPGPVLLGMDANSPSVDHPDHNPTRCHFRILGPGDFKNRLLGPQPRHRLRDVLRTHLTADPDGRSRRRPSATGRSPSPNRLPGGQPTRCDHNPRDPSGFRRR